MVNGGFENDSAWFLPGTEYTARITTALAHSGNRSLLTGILNPGENTWSYSSGYQIVTIPGDADSAVLKFWNYPISGEILTQWTPPVFWYYVLDVAPTAFDMQYVAVSDLTAGGTALLYWQVSNRASWDIKTIDLTAYVGHTIQIWFTSYNDGSDGVTAMYVDDVSLESCR